MILEGHAEGGKSPGILHVRIERKIVRGDGQRSGMTEDLHRACEILLQRLLELFSRLGVPGGSPFMANATGVKSKRASSPPPP